MAPIAIAKLVGGVAAIALVGGLLWMVRDALIEKGMNIVQAQNNAAIVKAQAEQESKDKVTINQQRKYIERLEESGVKIVQQVRNVPGPCTNDGRGDTRLDAISDWVRDSLQQRPGGAEGATGTQGAVPSSRSNAPAR